MMLLLAYFTLKKQGWHEGRFLVSKHRKNSPNCLKTPKFLPNCRFKTPKINPIFVSKRRIFSPKYRKKLSLSKTTGFLFQNTEPKNQFFVWKHRKKFTELIVAKSWKIHRLFLVKNKRKIDILRFIFKHDLHYKVHAEPQ